MSALINWGPDANFWNVNKKYLAIKEFKSIYDIDKSKNKENSSDFMWTLSFYADNTEHNIYRNIAFDERVELIEENTGCKFIPSEYQNEVELYQKFTLDPFERSMVAFLMKLEEREQFITKTEYSMNNPDKLDKILSNTKLLHDLYKSLQDEIEKHKNQSSGITRGGIQESASEQHLM